MNSGDMSPNDLKLESASSYTNDIAALIGGGSK